MVPLIGCWFRYVAHPSYQRDLEYPHKSWAHRYQPRPRHRPFYYSIPLGPRCACLSFLLFLLLKVYDSPTGKTIILLLQNTGAVRRRMGPSSCWYDACLTTDLDTLLSYSSDQWSWRPRRHVLQPNRIPLDSCWKTVLCPRMSSLFRSPTISLTDIQDLWTHTDNGTVVRNMTVHNVPPHGVVALLLKDAGDEPEGTEPPCARPEWCMDQNGTRIDVWICLLDPLTCIICFPKSFGNVIDSWPNKYKPDST